MTKKDVRGYLEDFIGRIERIEAFSQYGRDAFFENDMMQDGIIRNFEVLGEIVKRLDGEFTAQHPLIPWRRIAGFRDFLVHHYERISLELVWQIIEDELPSLKASVQIILDAINEGDD